MRIKSFAMWFPKNWWKTNNLAWTRNCWHSSIKYLANFSKSQFAQLTIKIVIPNKEESPYLPPLCNWKRTWNLENASSFSPQQFKKMWKRHQPLNLLRQRRRIFSFRMTRPQKIWQKSFKRRLSIPIKNLLPLPKNNYQRRTSLKGIPILNL